jgi:Uma2 family endonuclease
MIETYGSFAFGGENMTGLVKNDIPTQASQLLKRKYTVAEFEQLFAEAEHGDRLLELIHGEVVEKMPTEEHGVIAGNVFAPLHNFVTPQRLGRVGFEVRHQPPDDAYNSRLPDISFSGVRRLLVTKGSVPTMPELAVEVQSPDDTIKEMREKATYYLANGAKLVWLIYPRKRMVEIYYANGDIDILHEGDMLNGEDILPGFTLAVSDIFADPFIED